MENLTYERPIIKKLNTGLMNKYGATPELAAITNIDGVSVASIIEKYGSPVFVISENRIRQKYREVVRIFNTSYPKVQFAWSYKTNYLNAVCSIFHQEGSWAEVVSGFEYDKAIKNGVPGNMIIFNGPDKSTNDLIKAIENQSLIHIDHLEELYAVIALAEKYVQTPKIAIRVNMDTGIYPMWDRFGFNYENGQAWEAIEKIMASPKLKLIGLHCHIGTFMLTPAAYGVAASKMAELAVRIKKIHGKTIEYLDMGGGLPSPNDLKGAYLPAADLNPPIEDFAQAITSGILNSALDPAQLPLLILETGRALIDEAGYLLGSVIANKRLSNGQRATILNIGVNILFTSFWYNHKINPAQEHTGSKEDIEFFGPLCMNIDIIRESISFPLMNKGDHVVIQNIGAYNMTQWMQFISLRPKIVLIDLDANTHVIRENETLEYINQMERTPEYLKPYSIANSHG